MIKKRILITGASTYGVKNQGDDAMFDVFCKGIKKSLPNAEITFLARHPNKAFDKEFGVKSIKNIDHDSKQQSVGRWFFGFNPNDPTDHLRRIRESLEQTDLVVIGGNSFMEVSHSDFLRGVTTYSATIATWARLFSKKFALYGAAVYPMKSDYTKQLARFLCNNASLVTLRENESKRVLLKAGVENNNRLQVLADPAFGLDLIRDKSIAQKILKREKIKIRKRSLVGIAFRHMYWVWNEREFDHYAKIMAEVADFIIEEFNADVLFIPNCTYNTDTKYEDDRVIAKYIYKKIRNNEYAHLIKNEYSLAEILSLYASLDLLISNRRHALIFSAIHNVPVFALSTGHIWHFRPWIQELNLTDQLISMTESSQSQIKKRLLETWSKKNQISKKLQQTIPHLREKALKHTTFISKLVK